MEIIRGEELENGWPFKSFQEAYQNVAGENINKCFAIAKGDGSGNPDKTALIFVRFFVENGERVKKDQKYIAGLRFYSFGDMATIDIISLDKANHRDIVREHANRLNWSLLNLKGDNAFLEAYSLPIFAVGAHLKVIDENNIIPFDNSGDFGNNMLGLDVNEVVKQAAFLCDLSKDGSEQGESFLDGLLSFMLQNKKRQDFYEMFIECFIAGKMTGQNFGGLLTMKVLDRAIEEDNDDLLKLIVEELTDGFAKKSMVIGVAQKMKEKK